LRGAPISCPEFRRSRPNQADKTMIPHLSRVTQLFLHAKMASCAFEKDDFASLGFNNLRSGMVGVTQSPQPGVRSVSKALPSLSPT
jgi:hypothetical protein